MVLHLAEPLVELLRASSEQLREQSPRTMLAHRPTRAITFTGATAVNAGTLKLGNAAALEREQREPPLAAAQYLT